MTGLGLSVGEELSSAFEPCINKINMNVDFVNMGIDFVNRPWYIFS
jgi:hypothetical protein